MKKNNQKAFTLFELLVSISIIAILTAVAMTSFSGAQRKARDSRRISDMNTIQKAAEQYYSFSNYAYPTTGVGTSWVGTNGEKVLEIFPTDPKSVGWTSYSYNVGVTYCACAALENVTGGNSSSENCSIGTSGPFYCVKSQQWDAQVLV